jgi:hypothetical protein
MAHIGRIDLPPHPLSKLQLSDRLLTLAQEAERAGLPQTADGLVRLACAVLEEPVVRA